MDNALHQLTAQRVTPPMTPRPLVARSMIVPALALPWLLAPAAVPDAVLYNQLMAVFAWGLWLLLSRGVPTPRRAGAALVAVGLCVIWAAAGVALQGGVVAVMLAAAVVLAVSTGMGSETDVRPVAMALWLAGLGSCAVGIIQYAAPGLADGWLVATSGTAGRAVGNLRQPNHLATALLMAIIATAWLWQAGALRAVTAAASITVMVLTLAMTASRTGALALVVLVAWAALDRRLPRPARWTLAATPLAYALAWGALAALASIEDAHFYGSDRLSGSGDISSSRFSIWRNALALLGGHLWTGVGWGHFNAAWTFTAFPDRPVAFFDHTHNLPLQLAVEMGLPAAATVLGLLGWALWRARGAWAAPGGEAPPARALLVMLAVLGLHSLLEYPLWYAYFLLPAAWALGVVLAAAPGGPPRGEGRAPAWVRVAAAAMLVGPLWALLEHRAVEQIFKPSPGAPPLAQRIEAGQRSVLFGHHADYAAVTTAPRDIEADTFRRPLRQLIDVRLLTAYAEALHAQGRHAEALYAAQRLREFRRADAQAWFKDCGAAAPPWQCDERPLPLAWCDLLP